MIFFAAAQERLIAEGIDTKIVYVTDDIASAKPDEKDLRRGIAGTFAVYKCGGAAADAGKSLEEVARIMQLANDRTYSFGVAFEGCESINYLILKVGRIIKNVSHFSPGKLIKRI